MENGIPIRSVSRTISVLQAINRFGSLSMMAIARHESLPYPTAFRIVQTLVREGLIEQEPTRKHYRPTALVESLAHGYRAESRLVMTAAPHIRRLTREIGWPVFVSVRVGGKMVVRDATHAETSLTYGMCHPGVTVPLLTSATGQACLASLSASEVDQLVRWAAHADEERTSKIDLEGLDGALGRARIQGYAAKPCDNGLPYKTSSIAVPILVQNRAEAVLTLVYFTTALKAADAVERYLGPLKRAADAIAHGLFSPPDLKGLVSCDLDPHGGRCGVGSAV